MAATARWCYSAAEQRRESRGSGLLSQYRRDSGWNEWANDARYPNQHWRMDGIFALARVTSAAPKS